MNSVLELFGRSTSDRSSSGWDALVHSQECPFLRRRCIKVRKSQPEISIGTCSVSYGKSEAPIVICPFRLLEKRQVFIDCVHLLSLHEPGNELHIVPEVAVPGGSIDYFLVSVFGGKVQDFVGIELQTLDTTGTVWPARQRFLRQVGIGVIKEDASSSKRYGMNWKMTAKTILVQLHHKIKTFETWNRHLLLVLQDKMLDYLSSNFRFSHFRNARRGDSMQIHAYKMTKASDGRHSLILDSRLSTDADGIAMSLDLQADANVAMERIVGRLESKISEATLFSLGLGRDSGM